MKTRLNGKYRFLFRFLLQATNTDDSVLNVSTSLSPRKMPGIYMILCLANDYRYYGETTNVSGRLASHKSTLRRKIHPNSKLQADWNLYGEKNFEFVILYIGEDWIVKEDRLRIESNLIVTDKERCYNFFDTYESRTSELNPFYQKRHSEKTKTLMRLAKKGIPNDKLGSKIFINGKLFPSIAQASRELNHSRKLIRKRVDSSEWPDWKRVVDS
uniref:Putative GIY-YIG homing endonuclease n=1 Tax=Xylochloris irregularis TaxID=480381 RepID=A0A097KME3_9CHLO|nr:putative GIY-YIG homing endonuclease [Xylochloris irregularis]AIT94361.1 putative GIY-YIG homing endonuclease [Xylochloris irregularis]